MSVFQTHLSTLQARVAEHPTTPALRIPDVGSGETNWIDIPYSQFQDDVETTARYWAHEFSKRGFHDRSVIGLWLKGISYTDLVHLWAISRAGFIPQPISLRMTDPAVTYELLDRAGAVGLIHDPSFKSLLENSPVPAWPAGGIMASDLQHLPLPELWRPSHADDITMIYHTSGSSSGRPQLVPMTALWLDFTIEKTSELLPSSPESKGQQVTVPAGSFCHIGSTLTFIDSIRRSGCFILPTMIPYPVSELRRIIDDCGLTILTMFSAFVSKVFDEARRDSSLLGSLQRLDNVIYGGQALDSADETWARESGLGPVNVFAGTEVGVMLVSSEHYTEAGYLLEVFNGSNYEFIPVPASSDASEKLLELVVPPESRDCPAPSLRSLEDGKFHTGDLFVEVSPGQYQAKGRQDDWIKMETALRCDTGSLERNAMESCGSDLISAAVVVGAERSSPVLIVEPKDGASDEEISHLKDKILARITAFHKRRYVHERIDDTRFILVVPRGTLPRTATKGNIQRKKVEESLRNELDKIYS
ncbi:hypothetical protein FZEAL_4587 [Fusarium zealandicum]|uniref:AMP-dependent synthetase/ligase domain-containing protein n=1 Tax=Fusarium zealandicum TaxID=1053134 RepID=A0A8H4ULE7_9HYPO|nr:hypothetical protein FZEAL_4587 [Fusarium zealandicum]